MPQLTYVHPPGVAPLQDGDTPTGSEIEEDWYLPRSASTGAPQSLEIVNGWLDRLNLDPATPFKKHHVQRGALSSSGAVGSTASIDYFWQTFCGVATLLDESSNPPTAYAPDSLLTQYYVPVPGANIEYFCPYDSAKVLLQWNVIWMNDGYYDKAAGGINLQPNITKMQMFYTDTPNTTTQLLDDVGNRKTPPGFSDDNTGDFPPWGVQIQWGAMSCRSWVGHKLVELNAKGWYSAGLRTVFAGNARYADTSGDIIPGEGSPKQTRVQSRSMRYILFKS